MTPEGMTPKGLTGVGGLTLTPEGLPTEAYFQGGLVAFEDPEEFGKELGIRSVQGDMYKHSD